MKRIVSLFLILAWIFTGAGCSRHTAGNPVQTYHTDQSFSTLSASGTDASLEIARGKELLFRLERGEVSGEHAQELLDARTAAAKRLQTDAAIAYVRYCLDVTDEANKRAYDDLYMQLNTLQCILIDAAVLLSRDPALRDRYDAETVESLRRARSLSDLSVQPLLKRERDLVERYEALPEKLTVEYGGREWTGDGIVSDPTLNGEAYDALYEAYMTLFHAEAGAIFLELVEVRKMIAKTLGFDSYAAYMYACWGRDYSPRDAALFSERVKTDLVPLFCDLQRGFYSAAGRLYGAVFEQESTLERIGTALKETVPELDEPWQYMLSHGMYDFGTGTKRMPGSFTAYFAAYGAPFLFSSWTNGFEMPSTVIHEFGHYAAYYLNGEAAGAGNVLDLAEIDAQGLELMTVLRYDTIYGTLSDAAETAELLYALYALSDGCAEDAFQQFAYGQETLTLEMLDAEYGRLCAEFGLDGLGTEKRSWTRIPHTFLSPFYYISYAVSMTAALELYLLYRNDPDAARHAYRSVLLRDGGARLSETLKKAGLADPFAAATVRKTANALERIYRRKLTE